MPKSASRPLNAPTRFVADMVPEAKQVTKPARHFCFTDYDVRDYRTIITEDTFKESIIFMCWQTEVCPTTGKEHNQGYIHLKKPSRFSFIKKLLNSKSIHLAECRGSAQSNLDYCSKAESRKPGTEPQQWGKFVSQGERSDIEFAYDALKEGRTVMDIIGDCPSLLRNISSLKQAKLELMPKMRYLERKVMVIYGPGGIGKTRLALHMEGGEIMPVPQFNKAGVYFNGCENEEAVLIDDFDPKNAPPLDQFKTCLDQYSRSVRSMYGFSYLNAKRIYITTNYHPDTWYPELNFDKNGYPLEGKALEESRFPLMRRFTIRDCVQTPLTPLDFHLDYNAQVVPHSASSSLNSDDVIDLTQ